MQDRAALYPGRVKLTPVAGQENIYDMERADQPTQEGTAINKANLLKDSTAAMYGLDNTAVPDDAFVASVMANTGYIHVTTKTATGVVAGIPIMIDDVYAGKTGANGKARISVPFGSHTIKLVRPVDVKSVTPNVFDITVTDTTAIVRESTCVLSTATEATISSSGFYGFSSRVSDFDLCVVGAGGGGGAVFEKSKSRNGINSGGGGGGYVVNKLNLVAKQYSAFSVSIGAGGFGGITDGSSDYDYDSGKDGGNSLFSSLVTGTEIIAAGGKGGPASTERANGGSGGSGGGGAVAGTRSNTYAGYGGQNGENGQTVSNLDGTGSGGDGQGTTTKPFGDTSRTALSPGGGGAAIYYNGAIKANGSAQSGGSPGVTGVDVSDLSAAKGTVIGSGGGGAAAMGTIAVVKGASGANGGILLRWRYKAS